MRGRFPFIDAKKPLQGVTLGGDGVAFYNMVREHRLSLVPTRRPYHGLSEQKPVAEAAGGNCGFLAKKNEQGPGKPQDPAQTLGASTVTF